MASLAAVAIAATVAGTAVSAYGQYQAGQAQAAQANYAAAVARNNATLAQRAADDAQTRGQAAASQESLANAQLVGRQRAALAGAGQTVDMGSALDLTTDTKASGKLNELTILNNADREALGYEAQGMNFNAQAAADTAAADNASTGATFGVASTLLSGTGTVADKWYQYYGPSSNSGSRYNGFNGFM